MVMKTAYNYHENVASPFVDEGVFTANERDIEGGEFASPIKAGIPVKMVSAKTMTVIACAANESPIGFAQGQAIGLETARYSRAITVRFLGDQIKEIEVATNSDTIAVGDALVFSATGGKFGLGVWVKDATPATTVTNDSVVGTASHTHVATVNDKNRTYALGPSEATGSIPLGKTIPVLFGKYDI
ncbi:MAG: hypothetical protein WCK39_00105 [Methanomassiliicoccales archaeon]